LMLGSANTTSNCPTRAAGASARPRCRPFLTRYHWQRKNSWRHGYPERDRRFESAFLQRRVRCEPDFLRLQGRPASGITARRTPCVTAPASGPSIAVVSGSAKTERAFSGYRR
jgi:hypothetical protein